MGSNSTFWQTIEALRENEGDATHRPLGKKAQLKETLKTRFKDMQTTTNL